MNVNKIKEQIAERWGISDPVMFETKWEFAMMLFHRTKKQIKMYDELVCVLAGSNIFSSYSLPDNTVGITPNTLYYVTYQGKDEIGVINDLGENTEYSKDFFESE